MEYQIDVYVGRGQIVVVPALGEYPINAERVMVNFDPRHDYGFLVFIVRVDYTTGSTMGPESHEVCWPACFQMLDEANNARDEIYAGRWKGDSPWVGYFERLTDVTVIPAVLTQRAPRRPASSAGVE